MHALRGGRVAIGLAYVLDESQVSLPALDLDKVLYVAIGGAKITGGGSPTSGETARGGA